MLTALQLLAVARQSGASLDELTAGLRVFPQKLVNVRVREKKSLTEVPSVASAIRRVEEEFAGAGRVLVRFSGTEPLARVMVEGPDLAQVETFTSKSPMSSAGKWAPSSYLDERVPGWVQLYSAHTPPATSSITIRTAPASKWTILSPPTGL